MPKYESIQGRIIPKNKAAFESPLGKEAIAQGWVKGEGQEVNVGVAKASKPVRKKK
jgi:hypothetical protein